MTQNGSVRQQLDTLEQRFQALRDQVGNLPGARETLAPALEEVAQGIAMVRRAQGEAATPSCSETIRQHIFAAIPDLLSVIDPDFNIVMSNWHGFEFIPEADRCGQPKCYQVFRHRDHPCEGCHLPEVLASGRTVQVEKTNPIDGKTREIVAFPLRDESGRVSMVAEHIRDITDRKQVEAALREKEELYSVLAEGSLAGVYLIQDGKFRYVNPVLAQTFGYAVEELIDRFGPRDLNHPDDFPLLDEQIRQRLTAEIAESHYTFRGLRRDGSVIHLEGLGRLIEYQGRPAIIGTLLDITERTLAAEALTTQARVLESMAEAVCMVDVDGYIVFANPAADALFGYPKGELIGHQASELIDLSGPEKYKVVGDILEQVQTTGTWIGEVRNRTASGIPFFTAARVSTLELGGKQLWISVQEDITANKRLAEATAGYLQFIQLLLKTIPNPIFYQDAQGVFLGCNEAFAEHTGVPQEEIPGKTAYDLFPGEVAGTLDAGDQEALQHLGTKVRLDLQMPAADGNAASDSLPKGHVHRRLRRTGGVVGVPTDITELQRAQEAIRESEAKYRELVENANCIVIRLDPRGHITFFNKFAQTFFGFPDKEIIGRSALGTIVPEVDSSGADLAAKMRNLMKQPEDYYSNENENMRRNGERVWVAWTNKAIYGRDGKLKELLGIGIDRTEQIKAENALKESEARYRTLFETSPNGIVLMDLQLNITMANQRGLELFGFNSLDEVIALNGLDFIAAEEVPLVLPLIQEMFETGESKTGEVKLLAKDGTRVSCLVTASILRNAAGEPQAIMGVAQDISDLKRAEEAVRDSEARLRAIFEHAPVGIAMLDPKGRFLQTNPAFQAIVDYDAAELQSLTCPKITHPEDLPEQLRLHGQLLSGQIQYYSLEKRYLRKDGAIVWVNMMLSRLVNAQGEPRVVATAVDITARKQAEAALRGIRTALPGGLRTHRHGHANK